MFSDEELQIPAEGINVSDLWVGLQMIEKGAQVGLFQPNEFRVLGEFRQHLTDALKKATGKDYDELLAIHRQMMNENK